MFISITVFEIKGAKKCDCVATIRFSFFIQFLWDFFHWIPLSENFHNCYSRFSLSFTVFKIQGAQKAKNVIFEATSKFYFSSNFDGIFFIWFPSMRAFRIVQQIFFLSLTVLEIQGAQKGMLTYCQTYHFSQTSTRSIFILMYSSVVNMLQSYHAALAKLLSFVILGVMRFKWSKCFVMLGVMRLMS